MVNQLAAHRKNGRNREKGTTGIEAYYGQIMQADQPDLYWPGVYETHYKPIWRRDPQMAQARFVWQTSGAKVGFYWELPWENLTEAEKVGREYLNSLWDDIEGGQRKYIDTIYKVTGHGWGWWEVVPFRRDDGLIGFSKLAWRDYSSFVRWDMDDSTGEVKGFVQLDPPNDEIILPRDESLHITFGDPTSPEGLSPLEAFWRPESFQYNLELILGIGLEHTAGYVKFQSERDLDTEDKANIRQAARALLAAQEGSYLSLPAHITAEIIDSTFAAAGSVLDAIKYYSIVKLQILMMQWIALSATADTGSNAAMQSSSSMFLSGFNAMMSGYAAQTGTQLWAQIKRHNPQFKSWSKSPVMRATPVEQTIDLSQLAQFAQGMSSIMSFTEEDFAAFRRKSDFLPEIEITEIDKSDTAVDEKDEVVSDDDENDTDSEFAVPIALGKNQPTRTTDEDLLDLDDPDELDRISRSLKRFSEKNGLNLDKFFDAELVE